MMRGSAGHRVWLALTACLACLLCLHGFLQIQQPSLSTLPVQTWTVLPVLPVDTKLPVSIKRHVTHVDNTKDYALRYSVRKPTAPLPHHHKTGSSSSSSNGSTYTNTFCPRLHKPHALQDSQTFQPVLEGKSWVFSAYYDARLPKHVVKVIGIADVRLDSKPHFCRLWFNHTSEPDVRTFIEDIVPETHDRRFAVFIYTCHLRSNIAPYAVSLVRDRCDSPNVLPVVNNYRKYPSPVSQFTVCGSPIHNEYNNYHQLVEMVEINRLFGADNFVFYNYSIGAEFQAYLRQYKKERLVDIVQWPLPPELDEANARRSQSGGIHYFGQLATLNDCLYRNIHKAKFIVVLDLDELLVPKSFSNWSAVISSLPNRPYPKICSAVFRNTFFRTDWKQPDVLSDKDAGVARHFGVESLVTTLREGSIWPHGQRSKYIADSNRLEMAGIHIPWKCIRERYNYDVSTSVALLHHYRNWSRPITKDAVRDDSLLRFKDAILKRISYRHHQVRSTL